jgi:mannose-6-phosphate isomerase-like protein (cupin superfamily)
MSDESKEPIVLMPGEGRSYDMGFMKAVFKCDRAETKSGYSISEWWLEPQSDGPGAHTHDDEDCIFYIIEGTASLFIGDRWFDAPKGTFMRGPAGIPHDFANRTDKPMGFLNMSFPGGFEDEMPGIVQWFKDNPAGEHP